jgi:predicted membrane protein
MRDIIGLMIWSVGASMILIYGVPYIPYCIIISCFFAGNYIMEKK